MASSSPAEMAHATSQWRVEADNKIIYQRNGQQWIIMYVTEGNSLLKLNKIKMKKYHRLKFEFP